MRPFWFTAALTVAFAAIFYVLASLALLVVVPFAQDGFDTQLAIDKQAAWGSDVRYAMLNQSYFSRPGDRVVVLGASTARDAFRPEMMRRYLANCAVDNFSLSGANISEIGDGVQTVYDATGQARQGRRTFVLGSYYMLYGSDKQIWHGGDNPLVTEMLRYNLYDRVPGGGLKPALNGNAAGWAAFLLRPFALLPGLPKVAMNSLLHNALGTYVKSRLHALIDRNGFSDWQSYLDQQPDLNAVSIDAHWRADMVKQRLRVAGGDIALPPEQFDRLRRLAETVMSRGDIFVIADIPIPRWHADGVPGLERSYNRQMAQIVARYRENPNFGYIDMRAMDDPADFFDSAHAKPRLWPVWSAKLAQFLNGRGRSGAPGSVVCRPQS